MLITGIKSKPVYAPLAPDVGGRHHVLVGHGVGGDPLLRVIAALRESGGSRASRRLLYVTDSGVAGAALDAVRAADVAEVRCFPATPALLADLRVTFDAALMGTRLYVAGPEAFMGLVMRLAAEFNLNRDEIRAEECGSRARRVHCIHCRTATEEVRTNIVQCTGCRRWLIVRDHYSRRLAAYMGVMVDAEAPGELPEIREVFV
jgi:ferredoxin-NADP reductase